MRGILGLAVLAASFLAAASASPDPSHPGGGAVVRATLPNGLRVVVVHNRLAPVVTTEVNYLVGSNEAPPGFPGMAHAQEHMMFRGSRELSPAQLAYISAAMGGEFDAATQQTVTQYIFTVAAEDLDVALQIDAIRMRGVLDTEAAWRQERGAIEQEVAQDLSNPQYVLYARLLAALFAGTPYAHDALGTRESFEKTTGAMLKKFYETWYAPNNAILVIVGDVEPEPTVTKIRQLFGAIAPKKLPRRPHVLGGGFYATRLYRDLRETAGLVYAVDSTLDKDRTRGLYIVEYGCDPANVARARGIIVQELRTMQADAVPADELRQAKGVIRRIPLSESSLDRIARGLVSRATVGLPLDEPTRAARRYLALTAADVKAAFARWIRPEDFVQVVEGGPNPR